MSTHRNVGVLVCLREREKTRDRATGPESERETRRRERERKGTTMESNMADTVRHRRWHMQQGCACQRQFQFSVLVFQFSTYGIFLALCHDPWSVENWSFEQSCGARHNTWRCESSPSLGHSDSVSRPELVTVRSRTSWTQIGMFRPIRMDHTNCLQVAIKSIQFNSIPNTTTSPLGTRPDHVCLYVHHVFQTHRYHHLVGVISH